MSDVAPGPMLGADSVIDLSGSRVRHAAQPGRPSWKNRNKFESLEFYDKNGLATGGTPLYRGQAHGKFFEWLEFI